MKEFGFFGNTLRAAPRKIIVHVLVHGIRHRAQIPTRFRGDRLSEEPRIWE